MLYPIIGHLLDALPPRALFDLLYVSSFCTMATLVALSFETIRTILGPLLSLIPFAIGYGFCGILLVVSVPR